MRNAARPRTNTYEFRTDSDLLPSGIVTLPNLCTPEHLVLRGTYNSLVQEYATLVTWPADATCRCRSATCPPSRSKASYLPVTRQETELRVRLGEARGAIRVDKDLYDTRTPNTQIGEIGNSTAATYRACRKGGRRDRRDPIAAEAGGRCGYISGHDLIRRETGGGKPRGGTL
jgi:hypothetical protein